MTTMTVDITFPLPSGKRATFTNTITTPLPAGVALHALEAELDRMSKEEHT